MLRGVLPAPRQAAQGCLVLGTQPCIGRHLDTESLAILAVDLSSRPNFPERIERPEHAGTVPEGRGARTPPIPSTERAPSNIHSLSHELVCPGPLRQRAIESNLLGRVSQNPEPQTEHNMLHGRYSIETRNGVGQSTYDVVFYIIEGRKEIVAKTSEYIDSAKKVVETERIIEEHRSLDQT